MLTAATLHDRVIKLLSNNKLAICCVAVEGGAVDEKIIQQLVHFAVPVVAAKHGSETATEGSHDSVVAGQSVPGVVEGQFHAISIWYDETGKVTLKVDRSADDAGKLTVNSKVPNVTADPESKMESASTSVDTVL
jgi:hypothetical protein